MALATGEAAREQTLDLNVGFEDGAWELIVKYNGSLDGARALGARVTELRGGFAILVVPERQVEAVTALPEIEYVEKPKRLHFAAGAGQIGRGRESESGGVRAMAYEGRAVSCILGTQQGPEGLTGRGVLVGIVDSGMDYRLADFRRPDGATRILALWDQTAGRVYRETEINAALAAEGEEARRALVPQMDTSGHGTAVAGIAAGNGRGTRAEANAYRGVAYEADLLVVKLGTPRPNSFPRTTQLMTAMDFLVTEALSLKRPMVVNLSFGNSYGPHDGTSLVDIYLNSLLLAGQFSFVAGAGNEGAVRGHARVNLQSEDIAASEKASANRGASDFRQTERGAVSVSTATVELAVASFEATFNVQIWKSFVDEFDVEIVSPGGQTALVSANMQPGRVTLGGAEILIYYGVPSPFSASQEIYLDWIAARGYVESGVWQLRFRPRRIRDGRVDLWLPGGGVLNAGTGFLRPEPDTTLTIPGTGAGLITVAAYDGVRDTYADFSGRGFLRQGSRQKPDLAAPGVGITTTAVGGGYTSVTGTSFAAPFVTGAAALLMEWGIVRGNDPYLYGEKIKAYLTRGARSLPGITEYPSPQIGWGALCLEESF